MDWDDPQWVQAWATVALLVAAVAAGIITLCIYRLESRRDQARERERRAEPASHVAGWIETHEQVDPHTQWPMSFQVCTLLNSSPLPVYEVVVAYWLLGDSDTMVGSQPVGVLAPGQETVQIRRDVLARWGGSHDALRVEIRFTDCAGRRWWRDHNGALIDKGPWQLTRSLDADGEPDDADAPAK